ncbi:unnamed protein product [Alopecurus aequalis]
MLRSGVVGGKTVPYPRSRAVPTRGGRRHLLRPRSSAKKSPEEERGGGAANALSSVLRSKSLLRAGAVIFALGFVDAGYSGDWSRIGAISKDTEELLKLAAYAVVPLCLALALAGDSDSES